MNIYGELIEIAREKKVKYAEEVSDVVEDCITATNLTDKLTSAAEELYWEAGLLPGTDHEDLVVEFAKLIITSTLARCHRNFQRNPKI